MIPFNILNKDDSVLVIVDLQEKLSASMPTADAALMREHSINLITAANLLDIPILVTEQYPKGLGSTEQAVSNKLTLSASVFEKTSFSCCGAEGFNHALGNSERGQVILVGQETHVCILQTALELQQQGKQVYVVEDAVCSRNTLHKNNALQRMQQQGITVINYESVLFEWLRDAEHPDFKTISAFLR
ncbi:MAG: isochorismatase family protein [Methylococcaceae bacterium]|nr:isochorismatase family protein [Methylococcaceae bacterium]